MSFSCHCFRVLLWGLPRVAYHDVVTMSLVLQFLLYQFWVYLWTFTQCQNFQHFSNTLAVCGARLGLAKKKTIKTSSSLRSAVFVGSLTVFIPCSGVLLLTLNRFLLRRTFWFLVLVWKRLAQSRDLRVRSSASNQLWFLYYRLWIAFCHHILYVLFCRACSVISVLLCTRVEGMTLCSGHICPLSFDSYVSTLIYRLFLSRMVVESFY